MVRFEIYFQITMDKQRLNVENEEIVNGGNNKEIYGHTNPAYEGYIDDDLETDDGRDNRSHNKQKPIYKQPCFYLVLLMVLLFAVGFGVAGFIAGYLSKANTHYETDSSKASSTPRVTTIHKATSTPEMTIIHKDSDVGCGNQNIMLGLHTPYILKAFDNQSDVIRKMYQCTWKVKAPENKTIMMKLVYLTDVFKILDLEYTLIFGSGSDPENRTTIIHRISGDNRVPPRLHTNYTELWVRYSGYINLNLDSRIFEAQLEASSSSDKINSYACGTSPAASNYRVRIVAGNDASDGAWPWIGSLQTSESASVSDHLCGVSLVTPTLAITAAHCVDGTDTMLTGIVFGSTKWNENSSASIIVQVDRIFIHPDYNRQTVINDIAVLQLSQAIAWTDYVRPVCLQIADNEVETYSTCYVAGWGDAFSSDVNWNTTETYNLQELAINLLNSSQCDHPYHFIREIQVSDVDICAQSPGGASECYGDSGGPIMCLDDDANTWWQVALVSRGLICNSSSYPNINARISSHIDFIKSFTQNVSLPAVKCEAVPNTCSRFVPYKHTTKGPYRNLFHYIDKAYNDLLNLTSSLKQTYLALDSTTSFTDNNATFTALKEAYKFTKTSSFIEDYMRSICASFLRSCSLDGPVLVPCRTFCELSLTSVRNYVNNVTQILGIDFDENDYLELRCEQFPYSGSSEDQLCEQGAGTDPKDAICGEQDILIYPNRPHTLIVLDPSFPPSFIYENCLWIVTASPFENVIVKLVNMSRSFHDYEVHVLAIGYGRESRRLDTAILTVTEYMSPLPPALFIDYSEVWIRYNSHYADIESHRFIIQFIATPLNNLHSVCASLTNCANESCVLSSWKCDNVVDCPGEYSIDEADCSNTTNVTATDIPTSETTNSEDGNTSDRGPPGNLKLSTGGTGETRGHSNSQDTILNVAICGTTPAAQSMQRIINGNDVPPGKWPWMGSLRKRQGFYEHHCGAVLIASEWALTAAHCLKNPTLYEVTVESIVFGDTRLDETSTSHVEVEIERVYTHPMYNTISSWNDLAVLKLATPVEETNYVRPICSDPNTNEAIYSTCYIAGWGMQSFAYNENRTTVLQDIRVNILNRGTCRMAFSHQEPYQTALDNELCYVSVSDNQSPCYGDSGGPVMCLDPVSNRWNLLGIVSHSIDCNIDNSPGLAARVSRFLPYIRSLITRGQSSLQCESIEGPCADILPYPMTSVGLQTGLNPLLEGLFSNNASNCHPDYKYFVCASVYYDCVDGGIHGIVREPCESFCRDILVTSDCSSAEDRIERFYMMQTCSQFPSAYNETQQLCRIDDDAACSPERNIALSLSEPSLLNSIGYPEYKVSYLDCVWLVRAPTQSNIAIKFHLFDFQRDMEALTIGAGDDSQDRLSIVLRSWEYERTPSPIFTGSRIVWIRYATHLPYDKEAKGFLLELWATTAVGADLVQICENLEVNNPLNILSDVPISSVDLTSHFPQWWRCDNVVDCPNGVDEEFCPDSNVERHIQLVTEVATEIITQLLATDDSIIQTSTPVLQFASNTSFTGTVVDKEFKYPNTCGIREKSYSRRIVGGTDAGEGDWPWMVSLQGSNRNHVCGATLLSNQWLITASHCTDYISAALIGTTSSSPSSDSDDHVEITVENVYRSPDYDTTTHEADIALVKLSSSVAFDNKIQPACLGTSVQEVETYAGCSILGWGHLSEGGVLPRDLQVATVPLLSPSQCKGYFPEVTNNMLCAGRPEGGVDSCQGDSGGPLLCVDDHDNWYIVGITSFGSGCGRPNSPGVYTRISQYYDFINSTLYHH